jgi:hypothetical protein
MQVLTATLTSAPREVNTKYGLRTVADLRLPDGSEDALWRPGGDRCLLSYRQGATVQIARDHKGKLSLVETPVPDEPEPSKAVQPSVQTLQGASKSEIAQYVTDMAALYSYCYQQSKANLNAHGAPDAAIQAGASSLFIAAQRHFDLA